MAENTSRYRMEEFQDDAGNVVYPHSDSRVIWMPDGTSVDEFIRNSDLTEEQVNGILTY